MKGETQEVEQLPFMVWQYLVYLEDTQKIRFQVSPLNMVNLKREKSKYREVTKCV